MQETWVRSLGWEDPLEKGKATHSSTLAWRTPWTVWFMGSQRIRHNWAIFTFTCTLQHVQGAKLSPHMWAPSPTSWPGVGKFLNSFCSSVSLSEKREWVYRLVHGPNISSQHMSGTHRGLINHHWWSWSQNWGAGYTLQDLPSSLCSFVDQPASWPLSVLSQPWWKWERGVQGPQRARF